MVLNIVRVVQHQHGLEIGGRTWKIRHDLKKLGANWNPFTRKWEFTCKDIQRAKFIILNFFQRHKFIRYTFKPFQHPQFFVKQQITKKLVADVLHKTTLPSVIKEKIYELSYEHNGCYCALNWTCPLCKYACCTKAVRRHCVCTVAFWCPDHGHKCVGNHD